MPPLKVIVIGGGLAGSLLANGLHNNHVAVTVCERDAQATKREGYQIRLGESSLIGFRACLTEEHMARILAKFGQSTGSTSTAPSLFNSRFREVLDLTGLPSYSRSSVINRVALRNLLSEPLAAAGLVRFGTAFRRYEIIDDGQGSQRVLVHFDDGSTDECDVLVGADGSGSTVNKQVGLNNIVPIDTHWAFLAKGTLPLSRLKELPSRLQKGPIITFSKKASFYYALYLPQVKGGDATCTDELAYDVDEASYYWGLNIPREYSHYESASEIPDRLRFCLRFVKDWAPEYQQLIAAGTDDKNTPDIITAPLRASKKPAKGWRERWRSQGDETKGHPRVWMIGDAIHAMQPNRGMGGNQAMHDCADILPELLYLQGQSQSQTLTDKDAEEAGKRYEAKMMERAFTWVQKSGGCAAVNLNLDGLLGTFIYIVGKIVIPILSLFSRKKN